MLIVFYSGMFDAPLHLDSYCSKDTIFSSDKDLISVADVVVFHGPNTSLEILQDLTKPIGQQWVVWSMESEVHYPIINNDCFDLSMTYKQDSDIWVHYVMDSYQELVQEISMPVPEKKQGCLLASFVSGSVDQSGRCQYLKELSKHIDVHHYGSFLNNRTISDDEGTRTKINICRDYRFVIAFENAISDDYVTEKYFDALIAGAIPIYLGAPNILDYAPGQQCHINVNDFPDPAMLAAYLTNLLADDKRLDEYYEWRRQPFDTHFWKMIESFKERSHPFLQLGQKAKSVPDKVSSFIPLKSNEWQLSKPENKWLLQNTNNELEFCINDSLQIIWSLCDGVANISDIQSYLIAQFPEQAKTISQDVLDGIRWLQFFGPIQSDMIKINDNPQS